MNYGFIRFIIGRLIMMLGLLMIPSIIVAIIYGNNWETLSAFIYSVLVCEGFGYLISRKRPKSNIFFAREGLVLVALSWMTLSFFGALPFYLSGAVTSFVDALFESVSGFTTTGASVLSDSLTVMPESLIFWRSFTLMIGGMGMLVFILYIIPNFGAKGIYIMRAELPGPVFGKVESRVSSSINILYVIYISMTVVLALLLRLGNIPWFEAILLAMGASGTGGFNIHPTSIAYYDSRYVELVLAVAMLIFGMSFNFFYLIYLGKWRQVIRNEELKWYLAIVAICILIITANVMPLYDNFWLMLNDVLFNVSSVASTTAYTNTDINQWPITSHIVLLFLMFSGAMSGSTTSGLKVVRIGIFIKSVRQEVRRIVSPNRVVPVTFDGKLLDRDIQRSIAFYLMTYLGVFLLSLLIISIDSDSFSSAFNAVIATLNNIGGSLDLLGPAEDYALLPTRAKLVMCITMIMGRLEIYPVLILFSARTWRKT